MTPSREYANALGPVHEGARAMAGRMDLDKNADYITDHLMRIVFPERNADDDFRELLRRNAYDNLDIMWRIRAMLETCGSAHRARCVSTAGGAGRVVPSR
ncbi:MAG: hypothetical protein ACT4PP_05850 [Sporichthyaceae bacterium]